MLNRWIEGFKRLVKGKEEWDLSDRRDLTRIRCHYDVTYPWEGKVHKGRIIDMSISGCRLRCYDKLKEGDIIALTYPVEILNVPYQTINCKVVWSRSRKEDYVTYAGLKYHDSQVRMSKSWVKYVLKQLGLNRDMIREKRSSPRADCLIPAVLIESKFRRDARVINIGSGGVLLETHRKYSVGELMEIRIGPFEELPAFLVQGQIASARHDGLTPLYGIEFVDITNPQLRHVSAYLKHLFEKHWS